ncbi:MAG: type II toxin-antitoxin system Phd/YefM family antitoxin [Alphaproteobacteria bacterium]|nr:type II toxin-antitoxin system Phd/YefM family antitoxin [Alphaproteobacteria bacterium]
MKTIGAAKFKEQCLVLLDDLGGDGLVITKRGKPVAHLLPYERRHAELIGSLGHKMKVRGDIFSTGPEWEAGAES